MTVRDKSRLPRVKNLQGRPNGTYMSSIAGVVPLTSDFPAIPVLIVESTGFYADHLQRLLTDLGCHCEVARTVEEAKTSVKRSDFELICISRHLPDGNGPELAKFLRNEPSTSRVALMMVTANKDKSVFASAYEAGFTEVFFRGELDRIAEYFGFFVASRRNKRRLIGRVLYLEDTRWMATMTINILSKLGLVIDHFVAVAPALEAFDCNEYDIVVTDIVLEGAESGVSLVRKIRKMTGAKASVPILAVTALENISRRIELFRSGVNDYICKPMINEELIARVSHLIINKQLLETVQAQQDQLMRQANIDSLTGLYNRRHIGKLAAEAITKATLNKTPLSLAVIDVDLFKQVNDSLGHKVGDEVLQDIGAILSEVAQERSAIVSRFGGEEFLLLMEESAAEEGLTIAEELRARIQSCLPGGQKTTVSIGLAQYQDGTEFDSLFCAADKALYQAKEKGRNRVCLATYDEAADQVAS